MNFGKAVELLKSGAMKTIIKMFIAFMSIKGVQELFIHIAEKLARETSFTWDDDAVKLFKKWSKK